ncbi:MAG: hypothetical protein KKA73_17460 [Chloroflexi bacterium]|nr:hypothetical protein [Chloroflexota bacterium]MBU1749475.1 hypothetical protein [Chloroflexota bacterium]
MIRWCINIALLMLALAACSSPVPVPSATPVPPAPTATPPTPSLVPPTATATVTSVPPLTGSGGGRIVFVSDRDGNNEIYIMNADGTDQRRLTDHAADDRSPVWSPGGDWIAFESNRHGRWGVYVMAVPDGTGADGTDVQLLTPRASECRDPAWSPNGSQIAFSRFANNANLWVMDADGANAQQLTRLSRDKDAYNPTWSPDGSQIACAVDSHPAAGDGVWEILVLDVLGALKGNASLRALPRAGDYLNEQPAWSPDGSQIAFSAEQEGHVGIYVVNADGTGLRRVSPADQDVGDQAPAWSPDGMRIAFQSNPGGRWGIYIMDTDGTNQQPLTTDSANDFEPDWGP